MTHRQLLLTPASQFKTQRQKWLSKDRVPLGTPTLFGGRGGEGKSTFSLHIAAQVTRGLLEGDLFGSPKSVLVISHEDDWGMVMKPRLIAARADLDRVYQLAVRWEQDELSGESTPALPLDLNLIRQALEETQAGLLIIDPLASTMGGDHYKVVDVRRALDPLAQLAQEFGIGIIGIMHFNKGVGNASDKLSGSHAFRDAVRSVLLFATDEETGHRIVSVDKSNYSKTKGQSFAFNLVTEPVMTDDGETAEPARVEELGESELSVSDIINRTPAEGDGAADDRNAAQAFLLDYLRGRDRFEVAAGDVLKAGRAAGFSDTDLKNARRRCRDPRIESQKSGFGAGWVWAITHEGVTEGVQGVTSGKDDTFDTFVTPSTPREPADKEVAPVSYLDNRSSIVERAGMFCPVCGEPVGLLQPGYCDALDTAHANHRADAASGVNA